MHRIAACLGVLIWGLLGVAAAGDLAITEMMYHPVSDLDGDEFLEILNTGTAPIALDGWCVDGIGFCFPFGATIGTGEYLVLASDASRFTATYGFAPDHVYGGTLGDAGERIILVAPGNVVVDQVDYLDQPPWPTTPDGTGPSLELIDPAQPHDTPRNWRASTAAAMHTAGAPNSVAAVGLPPWITEVHHGAAPLAHDPIVVTARVADAASVTLMYRIDFGAEVPLPMSDDGASGDGAAGDGVYGSAIPGQLVGALVRYRIVATGPTGTMSYPRTDDTTIYDGTMVPDPSLASSLPIFQWFIDPVDYQQALDHKNTDETEPAVFFYDGALYDNIRIRVRGGSARSWPKHHWKFIFPQGHTFTAPGVLDGPVDNFDLQGSYADKSYMREYLAYKSFADAGVDRHQIFHVRVQKNGAFFGLYMFLEDADLELVERNGLDPDGARYKAYDDLRDRGSASVLTAYYQKQSRLDEDYTDLYDLILGIHLPGGGPRLTYLRDNLNLPAIINFNAVNTIIHNNDHTHKNYFTYRDTQGTGRWTVFPWDLDLTFGRNFNGAVLNDVIWADDDSIPGRASEVSPSHPLYGDLYHQKYDYRWNHLIDATHAETTVVTMYFRRLRTLMDELLAPGRFEAMVDAIAPLIAPEAALDAALWGQYGQAQTLAQAIAILENDYLSVRRTHLFGTHRVVGEIPEAQSASPRIVINEIMYNPVGGSDLEYVELFNPSPSEAVDLSRWRLEGVGLTIPAGTVILPEAYALVVKKDTLFRSTYGSGFFVPAEYTGGLDDEGDLLVLRDRQGREVASVRYSPAAPWPTSPGGGGPSLELIDASHDNGWVRNWGASLSPGGTPGAPNSIAGTTPAFPGLFINEVLPVNISINTDEAGDHDDWIEIHNASASTIDLAGMSLTDDFALPGKWTFPPGTSIGADGHLLVWADGEPGEGPLHSSVQLDAAGGVVGLYAADGTIFDYLSYGPLPANISYGRFPDGGSELRSFVHVTPAAPNDATTVPLILNEYNAVSPTKYLANSGSDTYWGVVLGNGGDWFELVVTRDRLDIRGWQLVITDNTGAPSQTTVTLVFTDHPLWSDLRGGAIITISEDLPDDVGFDPAAGDWWINVRANSAGTGTYITNSNFPVTNDNWQLTIKDAAGEVVFGPAGEKVNPVSGIGSDEVFKLEGDPGPYVTPLANYNDGTTSTFGAPNRWSAGTLSQNFDLLRCGGVDCSALDGACVIGVCDGTTGLCEAVPANEGAGCDDGDTCTTADTCSGGACVGGPPLDCDDGNACTHDSCDPETGCAHMPRPSGTLCGDPSDTTCTNPDSCDAAGNCLPNHEPNGTPCTLDCPGVHLCDNGICTGGLPPPEVTNMRLLSDRVTLSWDLAGGGALHDAVRGAVGELPVGSGASEICLVRGTAGNTTTDTQIPTLNTAFWYLVRARNSCGSGSYGYRSDDTPRITTACAGGS